MKQPFPFDPFQDSLIIKLFYEVVDSEGKGEEWKKAIYSHLNEGESFFFTPRATKQNLMNLLPSKIRRWKELEKTPEIETLIMNLIRGEDLERSGLDLALELVEWIVMGFEDDALSLRLFQVVANNKMQFTPEHLKRFQSLYFASIQEEEDEFRKREDSNSESTNGDD